MRKEQRKPWIEAERCKWLCAACRYIEWIEDNYDCTHPLDVVADASCFMEPHDDCWGFRPQRGLTIALLRERGLTIVLLRERGERGD